MKGLLIFIITGIAAIFLMSSCSSEKRLQRRVERHGIKESIGFVVNKYPEYFKSKDTIIHDTLIKYDSIIVPTIDTVVFLNDSSDFYHYRSDSLTLLIDKLTGRVRIKIKQKTIYLHDTITVTTKCPQIICPDCEDLKDNTKDKSSFKLWWLFLIGGVLLALYIVVNRNVRN